MNNKSLLAIIFILLIGIGGYVYLTTPTIDIDDFSVEKHMETTKYESGKIDKDYYIDYSFNVKDSKALDYISGTVFIYDKKGNYLCEGSFDSYNDGQYTYGYTLNVDKSIYKKIDSVRLVLSTSDGNVLNYTDTYDIKKGENSKDYIDDVIDYTPKSKTSSSSSSSSYNHNSYSYDADNDVYGDYVGNSNTHKFHTSYCSWADNIKSGNQVSFSSRQEAIDSGYSPCGHCNP